MMAADAAHSIGDDPGVTLSRGRPRSGISPIPAARRAVRASGRVFRRSSSDRVLTGVAGGIGERLGIDPLVVRLAFVVLSLAAS